MKPYTNKPDRTDERKCLFSEIVKDTKGRKKAARKSAKDVIKQAITDNK